MRRALVLLLLASCRQVFGLDSPELLDAPADSPPPEVTGSLILHHMVNDPNGAPSVTERNFGPSEVTLRVTQDGTRTNVALAADGTFSFPRTSPMYSLEVATPYRTITYQVAADHLGLVDRYLGRLGTTPPTAGTQLGLSFTNRPTTASEFIASTGVYSATPLQSPSVFDWTNASWLGNPGLLDATQHDRIYYLAYTPSAAYTTSLTHLASAEITTAAGATTAVSLAVAPVSPSKCIKVVAGSGTEAARLHAAVRPGSSASTVTVSARATPAFEMFAGFVLVTDQTGPSPMDISKTTTYANPFSSDAVAVMQALVARTIGPTTTFERTQLWVPTDGTCGADVQMPAGMVAIPTGFRLAGVELVDDTRFTLPASSSVELGWSVTSERADSFFVDVLEVGANALIPVVTYVTTEPRLELDTTVITRGHDYVFNITVISGQPNVATGDFRTYESQAAFSNAYSPVVSIQ